MSVLSTESFIAFAPVAGTDDTFTQANTDLRNSTAANLRRAGYDVYIGTQAAANNGTGLVVRPDPVNPDRNALFFSSSGIAVTPNIGAGIRKAMPSLNGEAIIGGFTLFVPNEFIKSSVAVNNSMLRVVAGPAGDTWSALPTEAGEWSREVFRITQDLLIRWNTDAPQSQKLVPTGRVCFLEYRISPTDVRVWMDDVLVLQKIVPLNVSNIAILFDQYISVNGSSAMIGAPARWSIGNWYNLVEDAVAPNVRLGPTTRIIGVRPNTDVSTKFQRPVGYASNAAVVASDLVDAPAATLQSTSVGDQDIYSTTADTTTASGKMIHAVAVKVLASNLESNPHTIRPILRSQDGTESQTPKPRQWFVGSSNPISTKNLNCIARRPTDGKFFAVGNSIALLTNTQDAAPGTPWTLISDDGGSINYQCIAFRSDGWGVIGQSNGQVRFIPPGSDTPGAAVALASFTNVVNAAVLPDSRFFLSGAVGGSSPIARIAIGPLPATSTPDVVANWTSLQWASGNGTARMMAFSPTLGTGKGRILVVTDVTGGNANCYRSDDGGVTWVGIYDGLNANHYTVTWDSYSSAFYTCASATSSANIRKSSDGITWTGLTSTTNLNGAATGQPLQFYNDPDVQLMVMLGLSTSLFCTVNSNEWRPISRPTSISVRWLAKCASGNLVGIGDTGLIVHYASPPTADGAMAPLGGYQPYYATASVNPATGAAWAPGEASTAQFGMRLTS